MILVTNIHLIRDTSFAEVESNSYIAIFRLTFLEELLAPAIDAVANPHKVPANSELTDGLSLPLPCTVQLEI
jgi:hypothetical protein